MGGGGSNGTGANVNLPWEGGYKPQKYDPEQLKQEIGGAASSLFKRGPEVFDKNLHLGMGDSTKNTLNVMRDKLLTGGGQNAFDDAFNFASNTLKNSQQPGIARTKLMQDTNAPTAGLIEGQLMNTAKGDFLKGSNPFFNDAVNNAVEDTITDANANFNASGRFGGGSHVGKIIEGVGRVRTNANVQNYENERDRQLQALNAITGERHTAKDRQIQAIGAIGNEDNNRLSTGFTAASTLPALYDNSLTPLNKTLAIDQIFDQDRQAKLLGEKDLFDRKSDFAHLANFMNMNPEAYKEAKKSNPFFDIIGLGAQVAGALI